MEASERLAELEPFIGEWSIEMVATDAPPSDLRGHSTFEWTLGGQYLLQRTEVPIPEAPDAFCLYSRAAHGNGFTQHYYDSRGVVRLYAMTFDNGLWTLARTEPDFSDFNFSQRFNGQFSDDGRTIAGVWEIAHDHATWELDFDLIYTKV